MNDPLFQLADGSATRVCFSIPGVVARMPRVRADHRGSLLELWRDDETLSDHNPRMAYFSSTRSGQTRGPHEHLAQSDLFVFLAPAFTVWLWDNRLPNGEPRPCLRLELTPDLLPLQLLIPPGVVHAYRANGDGALLINLPDALYAGRDRRGPVDEIRHENNLDSPFLAELIAERACETAT